MSLRCQVCVIWFVLLASINRYLYAVACQDPQEDRPLSWWAISCSKKSLSIYLSCRSSARTGETTQQATNATMSAITAVHSFPKEIMRCLAVYSFPECLPEGPPGSKTWRNYKYIYIYIYGHTQCEMPHCTSMHSAIKDIPSTKP